jgi:hypothetical protein
MLACIQSLTSGFESRVKFWWRNMASLEGAFTQRDVTVELKTLTGHLYELIKTIKQIKNVKRRLLWNHLHDNQPHNNVSVKISSCFMWIMYSKDLLFIWFVRCVDLEDFYFKPSAEACTRLLPMYKWSSCSSLMPIVSNWWPHFPSLATE